MVRAGLLRKKRQQLRQVKEARSWNGAMELLMKRPLADTNRGAGAAALFREGVAHVTELAPESIRKGITAAMRPESRGGAFKANSPHRLVARFRRLLEPAGARGKASAKIHADQDAARALEEARISNRSISDEELKRVLRALPIRRNGNRKNIGEHRGVTLGVVKSRDANAHAISASTKAFPNVVRLICRWFEAKCGNRSQRFPFTSVTVNVNFPSRVHRDANNEGPSVVAAVGNWSQGGRLRYWPGERYSKGDLPSGPAPVKLDVRSPVLFDGNHAHGVEPFRGERFSMVLFTAKGFKPSAQTTTQLLDYRIDPGTLAAMQFYKSLLFRDGHCRLSDE